MRTGAILLASFTEPADGRPPALSRATKVWIVAAVLLGCTLVIGDSFLRDHGGPTAEELARALAKRRKRGSRRSPISRGTSSGDNGPRKTWPARTPSNLRKSTKRSGRSSLRAARRRSDARCVGAGGLRQVARQRRPVVDPRADRQGSRSRQDLARVVVAFPLRYGIDC